MCPVLRFAGTTGRVKEHSDTELLAEFSARGAEAAFAELVRRHVDLVHSAARRIVQDADLAKDVTQNVFIALARDAKAAAKLRGESSLAAWLHTMTRNQAANVVRSESRRRTREHTAMLMSEEPADSDGAHCWRTLEPELDDLLGQLTEPDRSVLLARYFEKLTAGEIAARLGVGEEAAQKRVSRALDRLRTLAGGRGVTTRAAGLGGVLLANGVQAAPPALAASVVNVSLAAVASTGAGTAGAASWFALGKAHFATVLAAGALMAIPIARQRTELIRLRTMSLPTRALLPPTAQANRPVISERDEIERLKTEAARLRELIAAKQASPSADRTAAATPFVLLQIGREVPLSDFVFAGDATPEAAIQSGYYFMRSGDVISALALELQSGTGTTETERILGDPAIMTEFERRAAEHVSNLQSLTLLGREDVNDRLAGLRIRKTTTEGRSETNRIVMGRTPRGWRFAQ